MIDFGEETDLGRGHGVIGRQKEFELENAAFVGGVGGTFDGDAEVAEVVGVRGGRDAGYGFGDEALGFLWE